MYINLFALIQFNSIKGPIIQLHSSYETIRRTFTVLLTCLSDLFMYVDTMYIKML